MMIRVSKINTGTADPRASINDAVLRFKWTNELPAFLLTCFVPTICTNVFVLFQPFMLIAEHTGTVLQLQNRTYLVINNEIVNHVQYCHNAICKTLWVPDYRDYTTYSLPSALNMVPRPTHYFIPEVDNMSLLTTILLWQCPQ
jgi:hypothetical protein